MTGRRRSSIRRRRYGSIISEPGVDEAPDQDSIDTVLFVYLLFAQMYALPLYCICQLDLGLREGSQRQRVKAGSKAFRGEGWQQAGRTMLQEELPHGSNKF